MLAKYRSGALPKAFKIIPTLSNWEEIIYLTNPDEWSNQAMYQATRIFASNLKEKMAQRYAQFHACGSAVAPVTTPTHKTLNRLVLERAQLLQPGVVPAHSPRL